MTQAAKVACVFLLAGVKIGSVYLVLASTTANAQDVPPDVMQRLDRLEAELNTLNAATFRDGREPVPLAGGGGAPNNAALTDVQTRLDGLERQLRDMTGQIEEANYKAQQAQDAAAKAATDTDMRLQALEAKIAGGAAVGAGAGAVTLGGSPADTTMTGGSSADTVGTTGTGLPMPESDTGNAMNATGTAAGSTDPMDGPAPSDSPTTKTLGEVTSSGSAGSQDAATLYETAYTQLKNGNAAAAQAGFSNFLSAYPDHPLAANASYWYAETYYAQDKFADSSRLFAESFQKYPKGPKAADSVLKLGLSLAESGKPKDACIALKQIDRSYKDADSAIIQRAAEERTKLDCK